MKIKGKFEMDIPDKLLKDAKQLGWTKETLTLFVQESLNGWVQDSVYESLHEAIKAEKESE